MRCAFFLQLLTLTRRFARLKCTEGEEVGLFIIGQRQLLFPFLRGKESRDCLKTTFSFVGYKSILLKAGIFIFNISLVVLCVGWSRQFLYDSSPLCLPVSVPVFGLWFCEFQFQI